MVGHLGATLVRPRFGSLSLGLLVSIVILSNKIIIANARKNSIIVIIMIEDNHMTGEDSIGEGLQNRGCVSSTQDSNLPNLVIVTVIVVVIVIIVIIK